MNVDARQAPRSKRRKHPGERSQAGIDLRTLNPPQLEAVLHDDGPMLVLAGAGSGKTRVIIYRIARLIEDGTDPKRILGVTFTNKAAGEMRERLVGLIGRRGSNVFLSTFHSLELRVLKEEYEAAGLQKRFVIYDTGDQMSLVRELMRRVKVADRRLDAGRVLDVILKTKREGRKEVAIDWGDDYELAAYELYPRYIEQMRAYNAVDFDDLLIKSLQVLKIPEIGQRWSEKFDYMLVDEYQDTSTEQLEMLRILAGERNNVCVVGDDDQSIYAWRGAVVDNILAFSREFDGAKEVILDQNYRSTSNILNAANGVIKNNAVRKAKKLWSDGGMGDPVEVVSCRDGEDEANFVAENIGKLVFNGANHHDVAVLYRSNMQSRIFEEILAAEKIPYKVVGGQSFFERKEVKDSLAFLQVANNPNDEIALRRIVNVPPRGIGATSLERLAAFGQAEECGLFGALCRAKEVPDLPKTAQRGCQDFMDLMGPASERLNHATPGQMTDVVRWMLEELKIRDSIMSADDSPKICERRIENVDEVINSVSRFENNNPGSDSLLQDYLQASTLVRDSKKEEDRSEVTLMTLHSAKGLEFPYVFMVGMEEDILPHRRSLELGGELSEERRLCYVGITRAKQRLWMSSCAYRASRGKMAERGSSRFLEELPEGDGVRRWGRESPPDDEQTDDAANAFFEKMRAQLGLE